MTSPSELTESTGQVSSGHPDNLAENAAFEANAADNLNQQPAFGWTTYAERLNGRFAMVGFIALLILEFWTRQDFFTWLGLP